MHRHYRTLEHAVALALTVSLLTVSDSLGAEPTDLNASAVARAAQELGIAPTEVVTREFVPDGVSMGDRSFAVGKFETPARDRGVFVAVDTATGETLNATEFQFLLETWRGRPDRDKFAPSARAALAGGQPQVLGFFLGPVDYAGAIAGVQAQHPDLTWVDGFPETSDLETLRTVRRELMLAKADAVAAFRGSFMEDARTRGLEEPFAMDLAPLVFLRAAPAAAEALAARDDVVEIRLASPFLEAMASAYPDVQANESYNNGWRGSGIRIGIVEYGKIDWTRPGMSTVPKQRLYVGGSYPNFTCAAGGAPSIPSGSFLIEHMTRVAAIAASRGGGGTTRGIAAEATVVESSGNTTNDSNQDADRRILKAVECAILDGNADFISASLVQNVDLAIGEAYFDHLVFEHRIFAASAAGNNVSDASTNCSTGVVRSPGSGWNVLTVGGIDDGGDTTADWTNDELWFRANQNGVPAFCWKEPAAESWDPVNDRIKPEIVAPAVNVNAAGYGNDTGTSYATPMVAGAAATVMGQDGTLIAKPETVKAILLAGSRVHRTPEPAPPQGSGTTSLAVEGAGTLSTKWSNLLVAGTSPSGSTDLGGYGLLSVSGGTPVNPGPCYPGTNRTVTFRGLSGRKIRFVITWDAHTTSHPGHTSTFNSRYADLDLTVTDPNGNYPWENTSANARSASNVEWVDFTAPMTGTYTARINTYRWGCEVASERVGWAWVSYSVP